MTTEVGYVKNIRNFLLYLDGLPTIKINELVVNDQGIRGLVSALMENQVEVLLLDNGQVYPEQIFKRVNQTLAIPVGNFLLGRAINPLAVPIDGKPSFVPGKVLAQLDKQAPGIKEREFIKQPFLSGMTMIDTLIPLGQGQRELVMGDARCGKTEFLLDIIANQQKKEVVCVYAAIGKPITEIRNILNNLESRGSLAYTVLVASSSSDLSPLIFLTPQSALAIAEFFQAQGKHVLIILDDLGIHAKIYREISLLGNRAAGRESYPGDIFYQHSHLLERAGNFKNNGSITALPVIELNMNDFTTLIPTNLMSMTDGHLLFKASLYSQGQYPAIDLSLSVSRVGQQTQTLIQNLIAIKVKQTLAQAKELETITRFSFELPRSTQLILKQRDLLEEMLKQSLDSPISSPIQTILLSLCFTSFLQNKNKSFVAKYKPELIRLFEADPELKKITKLVFQLRSEIELIKILEQSGGRIGKLLKLNTK